MSADNVQTNTEQTTTPDQPETVPYLQKLFDKPLLLLAAGLIVMFGFYTIWGVFEVMTLEKAPLP